jgi:hypothetical protein
LYGSGDGALLKKSTGTGEGKNCRQLGGKVMLATNKTPLPDQQNSSKQFQFNLIKVVYEVKEEKQNSIPQVYTIPEVAEILKCKIKTVEGHLYEARDLSYLKVGRGVTLGRQIVDKGLDSTTLSENA